MRVNTRVFTERQDMFDGIVVTNCPSQFKGIAENIMNMVANPGYSVGTYHTMTELDKMLMVDYWGEYDGLRDFDDTFLLSFKEWFVKKATPPELIRRARQWLSEHNYLILNQEVLSRASEAGDKFSRAFKQ